MSAHRKQSVLPEHDRGDQNRGDQSCDRSIDPTDVAPLTRELDVVKRDRFELLSAYLDGEVTPDERRLVDQWLRDDTVAQCLHARLLHLRRGFTGLSHPSPGQSTPPATEVAEGVIDRLNHRFNRTCMAGIAAAAIAVVGSLSGAVGNRPWAQVVTEAEAPIAQEVPLEIALDQPAIAIPKASVTPAHLTQSMGRDIPNLARERSTPLGSGLPQSEL
jgi:hypothetical protein